MSTRVFQLQISDQEHRARCDRLRDHLVAEGLSGAVLFDNAYLLYYTGFAFIPTERPMAFVLNRAGEKALFVPRLELEHAQANAVVDRVEHYPEYPDHPHPMSHLAKLARDMGLSARVGADEDGYAWVFGYEGPSLSEATGAQVTRLRPFVERQMMVKSPAEIGLIRESVRWANLAHTLLQRYTVVGASETEVSQRASAEAQRALLDAIGPIYRAQSAFEGGASAGYRGQIGRNAAIPHALAADITFQPGDVLVTGAGAPVWGYNSELERTMILGRPSDDQRRFFEHMLALQDTALGAMKPGVRCADVDLAVRSYFEAHDLFPFWKHHSGHAIGLRYHEAPFLDRGDPSPLAPGMVFTIEPGLYVPGLGGFRHSDTVLVTEDGVEILTYYARDLESLTLPA
jgi:Xaa-Pro aminopeptidase